jgi:hypothetical protein
MEAAMQENLGGGAHRRATIGNYLSAASFGLPNFMVQSAWMEHGPFAFWLVEAHRPRCIVELGTHSGYSYFAFCQAAESLGLDVRCYAVDTWKGDEHVGFYGEDVFQLVQDYNEKYYPSFSRLVRSAFDNALPHFPDGSIDLLHIDGRHFYQDVKHDFESWRPKLSDTSIVLFHDTNVRERNFGVFKLWSELAGQFPAFEFYHGHGLGVLGYGREMPKGMAAFFSTTSDSAAATEVRQVYSRLGAAIKTAFDVQEAAVASQDNKLGRRGARRKTQEALVTSLEACQLALVQQRVVAEHASLEAKALNSLVKARNSALNAARQKLDKRRDQIDTLKKRIGGLEAQLTAIYASPFWRLGAPLRRGSRALKSLFRGRRNLTRREGSR